MARSPFSPIRGTVIGVLFFCLFCPAPSHALQKATLQLRWYHHYQFAGYYAALEKGFYREAGLDVTIREGSPAVRVTQEVLSGRADFAVGGSDIVLHRAKGEDVVVVAQIFQHSPSVFLTLKRSGIRSVADLKGRRFLYSELRGDRLALLKKHGIEEKDLVKVPHAGDPRDLLTGRGEVMAAYSFNEPFVLEKAGEPYRTFSPMSEGIDFYGDNLFTSGALASDRPGLVQAFRDATLRGWRYALGNKGEICDLILKKYAKGMSREWLMFEAYQLEPLIQPSLVELGYQTPARWQHVADVFKSQGMLAGPVDPSALIFQPRRGWDHPFLLAAVAVFGTIIAVLAGVVAYIQKLNRRLEAANQDMALNEHRLRLIFDVSLAGIVTIDRKGRIVIANERMAELFGIPHADLIGSYYEDLLHPQHKEAAQGILKSILAGESDRILLERHYYRRDGSDFWGLLSGRCHRAPDGTMISLVCIITDITEKKRAELELRESMDAQKRALRELQEREAKLSVILEGSQAGIITHDREGTITYANRRIADLLGYDSQALTGTSFADHVHPEERQSSRENLESLFASATRSVAAERRYVRKDGSVFWGYLTASKLENAHDTDAILCVITDIGDLKRAQAELDENRRFLADLIEYNAMIIAVKDGDGRYRMVNRKFEAVTGIRKEDALGRTDEELFPAPVAAAFREFDRRVMESGGAMEGEEFLEGPDGKRYFLASKFAVKDQNHAVRGVCAMVTEITDRKKAEAERLKLEQQMLHTQKLESLGVLAGGIAHDFNNILLAILGNADLALMRLNKESPAVENLKRIEKAAAQAADLAKQMLAYSGKGRFVVEHVDLNLLLEEMLHMLEVSISKKVVLRLDLARPLPSVEADVTQLRQVIMNVVINASEAIGDETGVIVIRTGSLDCDEQDLRTLFLEETLSAGRYVFVEITDTGCGMSRETLGRIFDPFFTTKFTGRGLGMAAVSGIVRGHKGAIKVYSEPGHGSTFKILLPASARAAEVSPQPATAQGWHGNGTVLLVDDEEAVRSVASQMLEELGFTVVTARDGREAVEVFRSRDDIRFVILDLTMPLLDGEQCFKELRAIDDAVKVIMSSGFHEQEVIRKFGGKGLAGFLQKPYTVNALREVIAGVLKDER